MFNVAHIQRVKTHFFSVEKVFFSIRKSLLYNSKFRISLNYVKFPSVGIFRMLGNLFSVIGIKSDIYHILGDIHYVCFFLNRKKTILTILDCVSLNNVSYYKRFFIYLFWYYFPIHWVKNVTVISQTVKDELLSLISCDPNKITVIPCCISDDFFESRTVKVFNTVKPIILQIGTTINKNIFLVAEALSKINCTWYIVGKLTIEQKEHIENLCLDYVEFVNLSDNQLIDLYCQVDILLFASTYEGFGLPIVEANALGIPVITSNISSMPEIAGNSAILIDPYSQQEIINSVLSLKDNEHLRNKNISNGYINAKKFSANLVSKIFENYYMDIVKKNN